MVNSPSISFNVDRIRILHENSKGERCVRKYS